MASKPPPSQSDSVTLVPHVLPPGCQGLPPQVYLEKGRGPHNGVKVRRCRKCGRKLQRSVESDASRRRGAKRRRRTKPAMEIGRGGSLQRRPTGRNQRGGVEGVYDGDPHCDLHGHVPPKVSTASASSGPEGKSADSQPIPRVLIHFGKSANCRTRVSSSSPGTLQVPLTGCTNRAISRTVCAGQKQLRKLSKL